MPAQHYNQIAGQRLNRIEALSDGVFAIAMTLLVLELKVPVALAIESEAGVWQSFLHLKVELLTYFLSFMTLGIFWMGQSTALQFIRQSDRNLFWIHIFYLMIVSLIPFTTAFLSNHILYRTAIFIYWANIFLLGTILYINWVYIWRKKLYLDGIPIQDINKAIRKRIIQAQILYALGALLCLVNIYLSIFFIIAVQLNYALGLVRGKK